MKNILNDLSKLLIEFLNQFGIIIMVSIGSMIARYIYQGSSIRRLIIKIPISAVAGMVTGILLQEYTHMSFTPIIAICSIMGAYTEEVLQGTEQLFKWLPDFIKNAIYKWTGINKK